MVMSPHALPPNAGTFALKILKFVRHSGRNLTSFHMRASSGRRGQEKIFATAGRSSTKPDKAAAITKRGRGRGKTLPIIPFAKSAHFAKTGMLALPRHETRRSLGQ